MIKGLIKFTVGLVAVVTFNGCYAHRDCGKETAKLLSHEYQKHYDVPCKLDIAGHKIKGNCSRLGLDSQGIDTVILFHEDKPKK